MYNAITLFGRKKKKKKKKKNMKLLFILFGREINFSLPKKLDADRKISIVQFAHSTRTLFIKLLAIVKWLKSSKKFDSCAVSSFL